MSGCRCEHPRESPDPRHAETCVACGRIITKMVSDEEKARLREFFDRLAAATFPGDVSPPFEALRGEAERRHSEGIERFGYTADAWRNRDNLAEGVAEESDGLNYVAFDCFQHGGIEGDPEIALALEEARYLYLAYECNRKRAARRSGTP